MREKVLSTIKKLIFMFLIMLCVVSQSTSTQCKTVLNKKQTESYLQKISKYEMSTIQNPQYGSIGGEWLMIGLARFEKVPSSYVEIYLNNLKEYVKKCDGVLSTRKYTEYSRVVLALTSLGIDPENFEGYDLLKSLAEFDNVNKLGINGPTYALIALDSGDYAIPEPAKSYDGKVTTREKLVGLLVNAQNDDGGWSYMGGKSDVDVTAMAMQALANYKKQSKVEKALEKGIEYLSKKQNKTGAYSTSNSENCESTAQVLTAMSMLNISVKDSRFIKNRNTVLDGLLQFYSNGAFKHTKDTFVNQMATEQGMYGLVAYYRNLADDSNLYDMGDAKKNNNYGTDKKTNKKSYEKKGSKTSENKKKNSLGNTTDNSTGSKSNNNSVSSGNSKKSNASVNSNKNISGTNSDTKNKSKNSKSKKSSNNKDNNSKISNIEDSGNTAESVNVSGNEAHKAINQKQKEKSVKNCIILILIIVALATATGIGIFVRKKKKTTKLTMVALVLLVTVTMSGCGKSNAPQKEAGNCTILVECSTIYDNLKDLDKGLKNHIPKDGIILKSQKVKFYEKDTVYDVLKRQLDKNSILMEASFTGKSAYVEGIDNIYEVSCGKKSGWMYSVNDKYPQVSCSEYTVKDGDVIKWRYTCDLGEDVK